MPTPPETEESARRALRAALPWNADEGPAEGVPSDEGPGGTGSEPVADPAPAAPASNSDDLTPGPSLSDLGESLDLVVELLERTVSGLRAVQERQAAVEARLAELVALQDAPDDPEGGWIERDGRRSWLRRRLEL